MINTRMVALAAIVLGSMPTVGFAQDATGCSCVASAGSAGRVVSAQGSVMTNGASGFQQASAGSPIGAGSEISVGANSSADISIGSCALSLGPNTVARLSTLANRNICVAGQNTAMAPEAGAGGGVAGSSSFVPAGMFLGLGAGAGALALIGQGDDPVSR